MIPGRKVEWTAGLVIHAELAHGKAGAPAAVRRVQAGLAHPGGLALEASGPVQQHEYPFQLLIIHLRPHDVELPGKSAGIARMIAVEGNARRGQIEITDAVEVDRLRHEDARPGVGHVAGGVMEAEGVLDLAQAHAHTVVAVSQQGVIDETVIEARIAVVGVAGPTGQGLGGHQPVRGGTPGKIDAHLAHIPGRLVGAVAADVVVAAAHRRLTEKTMQLEAVAQLLGAGAGAGQRPTEQGRTPPSRG